MDARFYQSEEIDIERLANDLENMYRMQGYEAQHVGNADQTVVQLKKGGDLIALIGLQTALTVIIQRMAGGTVTMIGQQKWMDKAAVGAVGLIAAPILWPLMLTAGAGAIRQASLGNSVLNTVDGLVRQRYPDVRLGPIPAQLMPQVQQQWAQPKQYGQSVPAYTPSVPVYAPSMPPAPVYTPSLRCSNCNTPYEAGDTFCSGCGRSLAPQQRTICSNCKFEIKPGVAFCPKCGSSVFQALSGTQAAMPPVASPPPPAPTIPSYTPPASRPPAPRPATPPPAPYVPPVPQEPPFTPKPSVTMVPGASKPATPPPAPKQPPVPVYTPPSQPAPPPAMPPTPVYIPPAQATLQTNVTPGAQTLQNPRQPIKARPTNQPAANTDVPWGKLIFSNGKEVQLAGEQALIGRIDHDVEGITPEVDLSDVPGADTTSRIHATIEHVGSTYMVTDLNSTNATRVNGKRLEPDKASPINDGESLQFGKVTCTFKKL
jgi:pSer/pThr/pTyr-binding forkhead associated (FHA) protein